MFFPSHPFLISSSFSKSSCVSVDFPIKSKFPHLTSFCLIYRVTPDDRRRFRMFFNWFHLNFLNWLIKSPVELFANILKRIVEILIAQTRIKDACFTKSIGSQVKNWPSLSLREFEFQTLLQALIFKANPRSASNANLSKELLDRRCSWNANFRNLSWPA